MNQNDIDRIVDELERRGHAPKYYPPEKRSGGGGIIFVLLIFVGLGAWFIFNQPSAPIQGNNTPPIIQATNQYTITESEAVILATSTPLVYPTNTVAPTAVLLEVAPATSANPMLQATLAGEWPRPITFEQYNACVANPQINPVCEDYLK